MKSAIYILNESTLHGVKKSTLEKLFKVKQNRQKKCVKGPTGLKTNGPCLRVTENC